MKHSRHFVALTAPRLSRQAIESSADSLAREYVARAGERYVSRNGYRFEDVLSAVLAPDYGIRLTEDAEFGFADTGKKILAATDVEQKLIIVDAVLGVGRGDPRRQFTLWHEAAHLILQGEWLREQLARCRDQSPLMVTTEVGITDATRVFLEKQANQWAAVACAPTWLVEYELTRQFSIGPEKRLFYKGPKRYCFNRRGRSIYRSIASYDDWCRFLAKNIRQRFGNLSIQALSYRVAACRVTCIRAQAFLLHRVAS